MLGNYFQNFLKLLNSLNKTQKMCQTIYCQGTPPLTIQKNKRILNPPFKRSRTRGAMPRQGSSLHFRHTLFSPGIPIDTTSFKCSWPKRTVPASVMCGTTCRSSGSWPKRVCRANFDRSCRASLARRKVALPYIWPSAGLAIFLRQCYDEKKIFCTACTG